VTGTALERQNTNGQINEMSLDRQAAKSTATKARVFVSPLFARNHPSFATNSFGAIQLFEGR
jgi:hypothetical protein